MQIAEPLINMKPAAVLLLVADEKFADVDEMTICDLAGCESVGRSCR
jgi:hypothetical protein